MRTIPKPEYPRPDRDRSAAWVPLNGAWTLETDRGVAPITVPFAWETPASGIARTWLEHAVYRRTIAVPAAWSGRRAFLCFGAVHHEAVVSIDGRPVGSHTGGYTSFELDVTEHAPPGREVELTVEVRAPADKRAIPHGKQRSLPRDDYDGVSFTPSSGIWQSVWLEARGRTWSDAVRVSGDSCTGFDLELRLDGDHPGDAEVTVALLDDEAAPIVLHTDAAGRASCRIEPSDPRLWSPEDPHLHTLRVACGDDVLLVPAGLRSIEVRGPRIFLNGDPLYVRGVLDQGYWPGSGITAPDDEALVRDLRLARDAGYNLVRKHLKSEEARFYHHADRMGVLVWAEPASTSRFSEEAAAAFEAQIPEMVHRDGNHPSIVIWSLYNEEWGLDWDVAGSEERAAAARRAYRRLLELDGSRPIVDNSGWSHTTTDLLDWHYYAEHPADWAEVVAGIADGSRAGFPVRLGPNLLVERTLNADGRPDDHAVPNLNSEYGGGFTSLERAWHLRWQTQELRRHAAITGYVYTELTDIEHESAGLYDADRRPKDWGGFHPADANAETVIIPDLLPATAGVDVAASAEEWDLAVRVAHHGDLDLVGELRLAWIAAGSPYRDVPAPPPAAAQAVGVDTHGVSGPIALTAPPCPAPAGRLLLWLVDDEGRTRARTHIDAGVLEQGRLMSSQPEPLVAGEPAVI